ncbi:MAG: plasmid pRiA4b ORF-3 family protein [Aliidongia sp.]
MTKSSTPKPATSKNILSLKVTLRDTKPPIWRRLLRPDTLTLADLHRAIQSAMGWRGGHLHAFEIDGRQYGDPDTVDDVANEGRMRLAALVKSGVTRFRYTYDFGDNWEHVILIEKRVPAGEDNPPPRCVAGKRACPPEDSGGPWGYAELLKILADPSHPEHAEQKEWIDEDFRPDEFDIVTANTILAARFG